MRQAGRVMPLYAVIKAMYFTVYAVMFAYASAYLLDRGFRSGQIGLLLAAANVLAVIGQQGLATFVRRTGARLCRCMAALFALVSALSAALLWLPLRGAAFAVVLTAAFAIESALQPAVNSLYRGYEDMGVRMRFSLARGCGSLAYSAVSFGAGQLLRQMTPGLLPVLYFVPSVVLTGCLLLFDAPNVRVEASDEAGAHGPLARRYPYFCVFLVGVALLSVAHVFTETFLLQLLQRVGGTSASLGTAVGISAIMELPAMALYPVFARRAGNARLLLFSGWMWAAKWLAIALAPTPGLVCAASALQFFGYALYVPASVCFIADVLPASEFLRGQALAGSAFTAGNLIASLIGGQLIDRLGMTAAAMAIQLFSLAGALCFTAGVLRSERRGRPAE